MNIAARTASWLPYDAEVEYLSTDTSRQCIIEIPVSGIGTDRVEIRCKANSIPTANGYFFVLMQFPLMGCYRNGRGNFAYQFGAAWHSVNTDITFDADVHDIIQDDSLGNITISDIGCFNYNIEAGSTRSTFNLFGLTRYGTSVSEGIDARVYWCKYYLDSNVVLDLIPVRVGSVGYMYDRVSKQLFGNAGTGSFIVGPDKT